MKEKSVDLKQRLNMKLDRILRVSICAYIGPNTIYRFDMWNQMPKK